MPAPHEPGRARWAANDAVLLTGATGLLGGLAAVELLAREPCRVIALARGARDPALVAERLLAGVEREHGAERARSARARLSVWPLPRTAELPGLAAEARRQRVREVVHCAGSVDYFDRALLEEANVLLTGGLLALAEAAGAERFVFLSTAFSCGYARGSICEALHAEPDADPTEYTRSKRRAEALVAAARLPSLILRPSVVVGDSRDGRYEGRKYGIYQLWAASERFHFDRDPDRPIDFVAPRHPMPLIHQDAFARAFAAAYRAADEGIVHLVSDPDALPSVRALCEMWCREVLRTDHARFYDRLDEVPREGLDRREAAFLDFTAVNLEILERPWPFERGNLERIAAAAGDPTILPRCDLASLRRCQAAYLEGSRRAQRRFARAP